MGEPLLPDHVFNIPVDEPELHPAYDFFTPGPLPGYAGNPKNNNSGLRQMCHYLESLKLWRMSRWLAPVPPPSIYEVGGPPTAAAEGQSFPLLACGLPVPSSVIEDLSTRLGNLEYGHEQLVKKVIQVQVMASQMVYAANRWEQVGSQVEQGQQNTTQRDEVITDPAGAGFTGSIAVERFADSAAADYGFGDEQL
uniref:Uncharacterized protein n=1 Tax=Tanacetum cinerariifolium TaxID=118510 RepID=A0A699L879_TANCI|nr:hypothetical protein [Tanacetum cinerariifolium]